MGYEFTFKSIVHKGPIYLEVEVTDEYTPATEANGSSVEFLQFEADEAVTSEIAGLWPTMRKWIENEYRGEWEKKGAIEAIKQGLTKYDREPVSYFSRRAVGYK